MKLRLLVTKQCPRSCSGCCNKDWDLDALQPLRLDDVWFNDDYDEWDEIIITGGEPLLYADELHDIVGELWEYFDTKFYLYTADAYGIIVDWRLMQWFDGITLTLHDAKDVFEFSLLNDFLYIMHSRGKLKKDFSLRLNSFVKDELLEGECLDMWDVRHEMEWKKDCPLPDGEVFMRLDPLIENSEDD